MIEIKARGFRMIKKLVTLVVALAMIIICGIPVFATNGDNAALENDKPKVTEKVAEKTIDKATDKATEKAAEVNIAEKNQQLINSIIKDSNTNENELITIKKPEDATVTTCKESYTLSGETEKKSVRVYLAKYNEAEKEYMLFANSDDEKSWDIGSYGKFAKGIILSKGVNKFKLVALRVSETEELKAEDIQVSKFTITYLEKNLIDRISKSVQDGIKDFGEALRSIVSDKKAPPSIK